MLLGLLASLVLDFLVMVLESWHRLLRMFLSSLIFISVPSSIPKRPKPPTAERRIVSMGGTSRALEYVLNTSGLLDLFIPSLLIKESVP